jgi:hypothetical protein
MTSFTGRLHDRQRIELSPALRKVMFNVRRNTFLVVPVTNLSMPATNDVMVMHGVVYDGMSHEPDVSSMILDALDALDRNPKITRAIRRDARVSDYAHRLLEGIRFNLQSCDPDSLRLIISYDSITYGRSSGDANQILRPVFGITYPRSADSFITDELELAARAAGCVPYDTQRILSHVLAPI